MAAYTEQVASEFNFPNITIYRVLENGVLASYRARTNEMHVMYDTAANYTETDPETLEERPVTYYYALVGMPKTYNFDSFSWVAVRKDAVDENYVFADSINNKNE